MSFMASRPGLNVRLSIDLDLQAHADESIGSHVGAAVLMNASTGEILVISSHPNFDPNKLGRNLGQPGQLPDAPFLNRITRDNTRPGP
jgi:cell division protein FtsI/penicillin-binding protein 2